MRVPLSWLKDYVNITVSARDVADKLTMAGLEVDSIETIGEGWDKVVIARVLELNKHPQADRLQLATLDLGTERITVVTGAPNLNVGDTVPFARVGAKLFNTHTGKTEELKPAKIRGILSEGMVCSEKELGLSEDHAGIMVLDADAPVGALLADYLGDAIFDIKVTPNRPDCLSVIGIAWEVAALTGQSVHIPPVTYPEQEPSAEKLASVEIVDADLCPRYTASVVTGIKLKPSPGWMQRRLLRCGMRPINNVVDITNYVMLEYGQPLHSFDYNRVGGKKIVVRRPRQGESLITLDGSPRLLSTEMLAICDEKDPVALAGVMGGAASEVTDNTKAILLESANFNGGNLRRTVTALKMRTEASLRFEKGLSPELTVPALRRATQLLVELSEGTAARGIVDVYPVKRQPSPVRLTNAKIKRVLGVDLDQQQVISTLKSLGIDCQPLGPSEVSATPPYWRSDIHLAEDLVEELARVIGYDRIPTSTVSGKIPEYVPQPLLSLKEEVRDMLVGCGVQEIINYTLTSLPVLEKAGASTNALRLSNPMSREQEYLRTSLRAGLLTTLATNQRYETAGIRLFEIGKAFIPRPKDLPLEREMLTGVLSGPRAQGMWSPGDDNLDFFDTKGIIETLFHRLGVVATFEPADDPVFVAGRCAQIVNGTVALGVIGEVTPDAACSFDLAPKPAYLFEIDLGALLPLVIHTRSFLPLPRFPSTIRDLALVLDANVTHSKVVEIINSFSVVGHIALFDVYTGKQLPPGKKSLAYRLVYQLPDRTLTDQEVDQIQARIMKRLSLELGAALRS